MSLEQGFAAFIKLTDPKSDGKGITLEISDKWMIQAGIIDGKQITKAQTEQCFNKLKSQVLSFQQFIAYLEDLAKTTKVDLEELKAKLMKCGLAGAVNFPACGK